MSTNIVTEEGHDYPVLDTGDNVLTDKWKLGRCTRCGYKREDARFKCRGIAKVRGALRRAMDSKDKAGFNFRSVFGCESNVAYYTPNIMVRVELRHTEDIQMFAFQVFVDFHLPNGADIESAEHFLKATQAAVRKARWARSVVDGLEWSMEELSNG